MPAPKLMPQNQQASVVANFGLVNGFDQAGLHCVP